ncbi:GAF domain-containing protein [Actinomycetospora endophytica]|uniref:GAF domain-containing protein n=1 Tax=Actinomycetospora endophytica TaxID=2291215 RepID=A0ABS8PHH8_9PSEU|nr:GAF domain-containing protein [Actinomycetospora endophytica]MCD2197721.1 GAF domain-containing protein [Actinomycetospora endophytica]
MDDGVCAVTRSTDLRRHARLLHQAHDARLSGSASQTGLRKVVSRSWDRVLSYGVAPDGRTLDEPAGPEAVERRRAESPIAKVLPQLRASLTAVAEDAEHIMVITAADGFVLWREGATRVGRLADDLGFLPGADWTEASVGTNAIGTALAEHASVQLFSAEHFVRAQHPWTCTASPIHDPRTGEMLGVVDLSGPAPTVHPTTVALVHTAVRLAESGLWTQHEARLDGLRAVAAPLLAREHGPALVVDDHGWVAASTGLAPRDRVAVPRAGEAQLVHGLGACLPERVPGGWMLRPSAAGDGATRLRLDPDGDPPGVVVEGRQQWRHALSRRHQQILALLMRAGVEGLDAAALSRALYDDADHLVTVRAELSRLRRVLGGLIAARPYRIAPGVEIVPPDPTVLGRLLGPATPLQPWS